MPEDLSGPEFAQLVERIIMLRRRIKSRGREIVMHGTFGIGVISGDSVVKEAKAELAECFLLLDDCIFNAAEEIVSEKESCGRERAGVVPDEIIRRLCRSSPIYNRLRAEHSDYMGVLMGRARKTLMNRGYVRDEFAGVRLPRYIRGSVA